jgi:hypothetical protein
MATSSKQIAANQANAKKSTGPRTAQGKLVSCKNSRIHGILSRDLAVGSEDPAEYELLLHELVGDLQPRGANELLLVEKIATALWKMKRLNAAESAIVKQVQMDITAKYSATGPQSGQPGLSNTLAAHAMPVDSLKFMRYQAQLEGQYYRALTMLQIVQTRRQGKTLMNIDPQQAEPM